MTNKEIKTVEEIQMEYVKNELLQRDYSDEKNIQEKLDGQAKLTTEYAVIDLDEYGEVQVHSVNFAVEADVQKFRASQRFKIMKDFPELPTKKQMLEFLKEKGIWGPEHEKELEQLVESLRELEEEFQDISSPTKNPSKKEQDKLLKEIVSLRIRRNEMLEELEGHISNTVEGVAESMCKFFTLFKVIKTPEGKRVWNSFDEMMEKLTEEKLQEIFAKVSKYWSAVRNDFLGVKQEVTSGESDG